MALSTARVPSATQGFRGHLAGWLCFAILAFLQQPGRTAADTKLDLALDPLGFLTQATSAYTDNFTLGQIQNQAYGYLFPQGLFFVLTDPLPDWVAQRIWWTVVMGVAFSGTLMLARRMSLPGMIPAILYALSPRILTTLTAISSEAWPVALVPWTLIPLVSQRLTWRHALAAVAPVALMGAVNATATLMACIPAGVLLLYRRAWPALAQWLAGCAVVSAWWIGPLLVLGRYSPPFTDFIESSHTTTYWFNLAEIFRGTTSWTPFVETERVAGNLLVAEPLFILATMAVAAFGFVGLASQSMPWRGYLIALLCLGVLVMGLSHGPLSAPVLSLFDDQLAPFRNLHKLDPVVRLPLVLGVGHLVSRIRSRPPALVALGLVVLAATAPAWSLRLAPQGTWEEIPAYWYEATEFVDKHAPGTRTLVLPETSFARQTWGWTRDEPIQALSETPFAVRDAVPLIDPEAIRGLDGVLAALHEDAEDGAEALRSIGVGAVIVRHDLEKIDFEGELPGEKHTFGKVDVYLLDPKADMMVTSGKPVTVAGGGEALALLDSIYGYSPRQLVSQDAQIVTDTPALAVRNYGTLDSASSAHLRDMSEGADIHNKVPDYPSTGPRTSVVETGGSASASSSASDASSFGGADPARSLTAAFDGNTRTAWWPQPGDTGWIESTVEGEEFTLTVTNTTKVRVISGDFDREVSLSSYSPRTVRVPGDTVRIEFTEPVGVAELDSGVKRIVTVPDTSPDAEVFLFQRLLPETEWLQRAFTTHDDATWELSAPATIDGEDYEAGPVELPAGEHVIDTKVEMITLEKSIPSAGWEPFTGRVESSTSEQTLLTGRGYIEGMRASIGDVELQLTRIDAGHAAFVIPPNVSGPVEFSFAGNAAYRASLIGGGIAGILGLLVALFAWRTRRDQQYRPVPASPWVIPLITVVLIGGIPGVIGAVIAWGIRRYTLIPPWALAGGMLTFMGLWLARAPWPTADYAGNSVAMVVAGCAALVCLAPPTRWIQRAPGRSTSS
ncbi:alpha-(1-_3)-arabinofuranosyltransferase family protein [Corynebacterium breve]|uniref:Alpha-(1->3)-arabinofuranosyltransferase family protein n=1 Tax=Corynebacterium breve TaxID=3049799 RepID=A0ABY8VIV5_9CORY|nr:alpha-(1->3)-arabinofuranosyltransferase family protein [Corynebacterium breve]WIM67490.1 alpha-(1->3)-arabinofuranosyltransferase family protein [Corynebacterium breve]